MSADIVAPDAIPAALRELDQWVCWRTEDRDGKPTKVPIDSSTGRFASTTDPSTWSSFDRAREYAQEIEGVAGLGFVFTEDDSFVGVDLDGCRDPETGRPTESAKDIVDHLDSYTEVSPSGTGYHVIVRGTLPTGRNRHGDVECYAASRYFTVTGDHVPGTPDTVEERSETLAEVHTEYVAVEQSEGTTDAQEPAVTLDDAELVQKARQAANGERFESLWNGSTTGYPSHSEADMALCCHLAFWTGGDSTQIDRLFRESGLMREKWDEVHFGDGSTYGEKTVSRAVARVTDHYGPSRATAGPDALTLAESSREDRVRRQGAQPGTGTPPREDRLRATIARLDARIEALETENGRLRDQLKDESTSDGSPVESSSPGEPISLWRRMMQLVGISDDEPPRER